MAFSIASTEFQASLTPEQRSEHTKPARDAWWQQLVEQAGGDLDLAEKLRRLHFKKMALASAKARRLKREDSQSTSVESEVA